MLPPEAPLCGMLRTTLNFAFSFSSAPLASRAHCQQLERAAAEAAQRADTAQRRLADAERARRDLAAQVAALSAQLADAQRRYAEKAQQCVEVRVEDRDRREGRFGRAEDERKGRARWGGRKRDARGHEGCDCLC